LTPALINSLLADLNKIWRDREKKQISRIKAQCTQEVNSLKRQLSHRTPYDHLQYKKSVSSLKTKLTSARQELSKT